MSDHLSANDDIATARPSLHADNLRRKTIAVLCLSTTCGAPMADVLRIRQLIQLRYFNEPPINLPSRAWFGPHPRCERNRPRRDTGQFVDRRERKRAFQQRDQSDRRRDRFGRLCVCGKFDRYLTGVVGIDVQVRQFRYAEWRE